MMKMKFYWPLQSRYVFWLIRPCHHTCKTCFCIVRSQLNMCTEIIGPISIKLDVLLMATLQPTACTNSSSRSLDIMTMCSGIANFIDEWSHCDFRFTNFGVILENLESSITTKKAIFRLYSTWSWHE